MAKRILVTSGLPYSNGRLHVGHIAGAYLPADIYVRFERMRGKEVRFVCGSDDHGVAIMLSAEKEGKDPADVAKHYNELQRKDFEGLNIDFDVYGATSNSDYHVETSQQFFLKLFEQGFFRKVTSAQFFDQSRNMFLPDRFVKGVCGFCGAPDQNGDQCENCGQMLDVDTLNEARSTVSGAKADVKETVHWHLDLRQFESTVVRWLETAQLRDGTRSFVKGLLSKGLVERSMTRDIAWGIPVPLDDPDAEGKVLYVWFDAPIGYISNTKQMCEKLFGDPERYLDYWASDECDVVHFVGEDNVVFHCIIWIAMLGGHAEFALPTGVVANNFLNISFQQDEVEKISKSRGTAVWIGEYLEQGGDVDALRYYLTAIAPEKARTVYKPEDLLSRQNSDLANTLGNFVHRIVSFTHKYNEGRVPSVTPETLDQVDQDFLASFKPLHERLGSLLESYQFKQAQDEIIEFCRHCNKYVDDKAPWATRKTDMPRTLSTLAIALNAIKLISVVLSPFLPSTAKKIRAMCSADAPSWNDALEPLPEGASLGESAILFAKRD